jgi:hypothetical protein
LRQLDADYCLKAAKLVEWLQKLASTPAGKSYDDIPGGMIQRVYHSSLQGKDARGFHPSKQMTGGYPATFAIQVSLFSLSRAFVDKKELAVKIGICSPSTL